MPFITKMSNGHGGYIRTLRVRAVLALIFALGATVGFFMGLIPYDAYMPLVTMAVGFFLGNAAGDSPKPQDPPATPPVA
jgi:hypothetical protein